LKERCRLPMIVAHQDRAPRYVAQLRSRQRDRGAITRPGSADRLAMLLDSANARRPARGKNAHDFIHCEITAPDRAGHNGPGSLDRERPIDGKSEQVVRLATT